MAPRRKVMWLIKGLGTGGAEKLLSSSLPYLDRKTFDYEVTYFLPQKNDLVSEFERAGIPVFCLNLTGPYDLMAVFRLTRFLRERKPDILHIHLPYSGVVGRIAGRFARVRGIVYTEHNVLGMYHPFTRLCNILTYRLHHATITVSGEVLRSLPGGPITDRRTLRTIHCGVDLSAYNAHGAHSDLAREALGIPPNRHVVGNVAHIRPEKGHRYLLEAAKRVLESCPQVTFVVVGREKVEGGVRHLEELAEHLGIRDRIIFAGFRPDATRVMAAFDVFVLSSLYEGLPVALLEAMALGKPAVATHVGGIPEVVDDRVNGFLVEPRNPEMLAEGIIKLLQDDGLRSRMSQMAMQKIQVKFAIQHMVAAVEQVYASVGNHTSSGLS
ncbi:MAG: glycosyltransferase [Dehalococcoidia bacterium]